MVNKGVAIIIACVLMMMYFMISLVKHFNYTSAIREQDEISIVRDSILNARIKALENKCSDMSEQIRVHQLHLDAVKVQTNNTAYKLNRFLEAEAN